MCRSVNVVEGIVGASTAQDVVRAFEKSLSEIGVEHFGMLRIARPGESLEDVCIAQRIPEAWKALYAEQNFFENDPAIRHCRHTALPFDWASAPYSADAESSMATVVRRAMDFNLHKGIMVPITSLSGLIGIVGVCGPHFDERKVHTPTVYSLAMHAFHRIHQLTSGNSEKAITLSERQREVLAWAAEGKTAWEIGCILSISQRTVETYFNQACRKLGAVNRMQAIAIFVSSPGFASQHRQAFPYEGQLASQGNACGNERARLSTA